LGSLSPKYYDYLFLTISAIAGVTNKTLYFLNLGMINYKNLAKNLDIPIIVILTKIDLVNAEDILELEIRVRDTIKNLEINKVPLMVRNKDDINLFCNTVNHKIIPIFSLSCKKGVNLDKFIHFLRTLPFSPKETLGINNQNELNALVSLIL